MKENGQHIIAAILAGKTDRFSYFLEQYGQQVFHLIVRMVTSQEDAEELTQDCFMKAFNHLSSFNGNSSFSTWLYRIAYNTALSFLRKETARQEIRITEQLWNTLSDEEVDQTLNTEDTVLIEKLQQLIKQLSPEEQAILTFYYEEEKTIQEIGYILHLSESNTKVKLHRIRKKLSILMKQ